MSAIALLVALSSVLTINADLDRQSARTAAAVVADPAQVVYDEEMERLERIAVSRVDQLTVKERASLYLGSPRISGAPGEDSQAERLAAFLDDPAVRGLELLESAWFEGLGEVEFKSARELVQLQVMVVRNINARSAKINREEAQREVANIRQLRERYADTKLFASRSVVYAADHDTVKGRSIFGRSSNRRAVERQSSKFAFLQPDGPDAARGARRSAQTDLAAELSGDAPVTLFYEGHGRVNAVKFAGKLSSQNLAGMLNANRSATAPSILISASCKGHNFTRDVMTRMLRDNARLPIVVVPQEYGQNFAIDVGNDTFTRMELGLGLRDTQLDELIAEAHIATSVYVPDDQNRPMQIL